MFLSPYDAFDLLTPLTFALTGLSKDHLVYSPPGTGFFVAPYTAITADHVMKALWDELEMPWKKGQYPQETKEPEFFVAGVQMLDIRRKDVGAHWEVTGATPCNHTDAAFLNLIPKNENAELLTWPAGFPDLELLPPPVGAEIWTFGYPGSKFDHTPGETFVNLKTEPTLVTGTVIEHFPHGRGTWRFPQFQVSIPFEHGMSGAPIVSEGKICGIVSYGPKYEEGAGESYGAALWPILLSEVAPPLDPRLQSTPILDMLKTGQIRAARWEKIKARAKIGKTEAGYEIAVLED